jgi:hypothetical protein
MAVLKKFGISTDMLTKKLSKLQTTAYFFKYARAAVAR